MNAIRITITRTAPLLARIGLDCVLHSEQRVAADSPQPNGTNFGPCVIVLEFVLYVSKETFMGAYRYRGGIIQKPVPPLVRQPMVYDTDLGGMRISSTCWAAALSSWLSAARSDNRSVENLVARFRPYLGKSGLDLGQFDEVAEALFVRMDYEEVAKGDLGWYYLYEKLLQSAVYLILENGNPAHALVLYAISADARGEQEVSIMDPIQGLRTGSLSSFRERSDTFLVGVARKG